ncbi:MAG: putative DNA repair protein MutK [Oleispira sp.]|jgi:predicted DNA repair protein MutK
MAGSSLLALIDDIASVLDDVAALSKVAAKKTAGVLGDDLALNAEQVSGVRAERELPVIWAVTKGSLLNKLILVPAALLISAIAPWAIIILLMLGGAYLCYEGFEKIAHSFAKRFLHKDSEAAHKESLHKALLQPNIDLVEFEKDKIKGAIRTDFILSAEIIVIILGTLQGEPFTTQLTVLSLLALSFTLGVYGLVAAIVKIDDAGLYLIKTATASAWGKFKQAIGQGLLAFAPFLMKTLSFVGTIAMFMVGGGILLHGIPGAEVYVNHFAEGFSSPFVTALSPMFAGAGIGLISGGLLVALMTLFTKITQQEK